MWLKAKFTYNVSGVGVVQPGQVFEVSDDAGYALMAQQYNHFDQVGAMKSMDAPPADKMIRKPRAKK